MITYRDYTLQLQADVPQTISVGGDYWALIKTPGGDVILELDEHTRLIRQAGMGGPGTYSYVRITSPVAQSVVISLGHSGGQTPYDQRATVNATVNATTAPANQNPASGDITVAAGGLQLIAPANPNRKELRLMLPSSAPDYVRWGDATTSALLGNRLEPGVTEYINTEAAVYVFNPNAVAVEISRGELNRP